MAWWVKHFLHKPADLSSTPRTHRKVEGEVDFTQLFSDLQMCAVVFLPCSKIVVFAFLFLLFFFQMYLFFSVSDCFDCMYTTCMVPMEIRRGHLIYLGNGVRNGSEPQCWCWESNLGPKSSKHS